MWVRIRKTTTPEQKKAMHRRRTVKAQRKRRARAYKLGLCDQCQAQLENMSSPTCEECIAKDTVRRLALIDKRIKDGICPLCRIPFDQLYVMKRYVRWFRGDVACFFCVNKPKIMERRGACVTCLKRPVAEGSNKCPRCLGDVRIKLSQAKVRKKRKRKILAARRRSIKRRKAELED